MFTFSAIKVSDALFCEARNVNLTGRCLSWVTVAGHESFTKKEDPCTLQHIDDLLVCYDHGVISCKNE